MFRLNISNDISNFNSKAVQLGHLPIIDRARAHGMQTMCPHYYWGLKGTNGKCILASVGAGVASGTGFEVSSGEDGVESTGEGLGVPLAGPFVGSSGRLTILSEGSTGSIYSPGVSEGAMMVIPGVGFGSVGAGVVSGFSLF